MNQNNNDLISRKAVLETLENIFSDYHMAWYPDDKRGGFAHEVPAAIMNLPCAYDKEAVAEQLETYLFERYCAEDDCIPYSIIMNGGVDMSEIAKETTAKGQDISAYKEKLLAQIDYEIEYAKTCNMPQMTMGMKQIRDIVVNLEPSKVTESKQECKENEDEMER